MKELTVVSVIGVRIKLKYIRVADDQNLIGNDKGNIMQNTMTPINRA